MEMWVLASCFVLIASLLVYVLMYMFLMDSSPGAEGNAALDAFIKSSLGEQRPGGMLSTVLTFGYVKATIRRCIAAYKAWLFMDIAEEGELCPDAAIVTLEGKEQALLADYVSEMPPGMPLVLNMGSYT